MPETSVSSLAALVGGLLVAAYLVGVVIYWRDFRRMGYTGWRFILLWPVAVVVSWALKKAFDREERR